MILLVKNVERKMIPTKREHKKQMKGIIKRKKHNKKINKMKKEIILQKRIYGYNQGGQCAMCKKSISGNETVRILGKYLSGKSYVTEPFNLCWNCYNEVKK